MAHVMTLDKKSIFDHVYQIHWKPLYLFAWNVVLDKEIAEDMVQEVFVDYWLRMDSLAIENPKAYLFQAIRNQCANLLRKKKMIKVEIELLEEVIMDMEEEQDYLTKEEVLQQLQQRAEDILPIKCLDVFKLRFYEHLSTKDIAERLGISVSTVENHINKAIRLLKNENLYSLKLLLSIYLLF